MTSLNLFIPITKIDEAQRIVYGTLTQAVADKSGEIIDYPSTKAAYQKWSDDTHARSKGKSKGNLRAMHGNVAAGKFTDIVFDDANERIEGAAYVSDDNEWKKCLDGTYTGFSHGGAYAKRWADPDQPHLKRYTPTLAEISLVDNPCVPTATFEFIKEDGSTELRKFNATHEVPMTKTSTEAESTATADATKTATATETAETAAQEQEAEAATETAAETETAVEKANRPQDKGGVVQGFQAKDGSFHLKKADAILRNVEVDAEQVAAPALDALKKLSDAVGKADSEEAKPEGEEPAEDEVVEKPVTEPEPALADKSTPAAELAKGMYTVSNFADLLQSIKCLQEDTEWEAQWEGDSSELPAKLKAWLAEGGTLLVQMAGEETAELTADKAAKSQLAKKGAALSAASKAHVEAMMKSANEHMDAMGKCYKGLGLGGEETDSPADKVAKVADETLAAENTALRKAIGDMTPTLEGLLKKFEQQSERIAHLESQPAPAKGVLRVVEKANDGGNVSDGDDVKKAQALLKGMSPEEVNLVLMKTALSKPMNKN